MYFTLGEPVNVFLSIWLLFTDKALSALGCQKLQKQYETS